MNKFVKKISGKGLSLFTWNEYMNDIIKVINH